MPGPPTRIWITRTRPAAEATAARVRELGAEAVVAPVLEVQPIDGAAVDLAGAAALAFTSGHGVRAFAALSPRRDLPAFCVGRATAALARSLGFADARSADGDVHALAELIAADARGPVVVPGAREPAADLPGLLAACGVLARAVAVYRTVDAGLAAAPGDIDAVLVHSPKAARAVAGLVGEVAASMTAYAISEAAAQPLREHPFRRIAVARTPDEEALLDLIRVDRNDGRTHEKP